MNLKDLGYTDELQEYVHQHDLGDFEIGRVQAEHKERYVVLTEKLSLDAEITGNLRFGAKERSDFPAVGDWVVISIFDDNMALIHQILPRKSILQRMAVSKFGEKQIIATNIDFAFIVMAVDRDFNLNRLERFLTISYSGDVEPIVLLSKIDLVSKEKLDLLVGQIRERHPNATIIPFSNKLNIGYEEIESLIFPANTYCVLGTSGVGKSTLINHLAGKEIMKTGETSQSTRKGRHVTSHRELLVMENGGILIDTPGMREVGVVETDEHVFDDISQLSRECKFNNCTHVHEKGCAVIAAVQAGVIDEGAYDNYLKMQREEARVQSTLAEKRKKDKAFGKMYKEYINYKKHNL